MDEVLTSLRSAGFAGEIDTSETAKEFYSHDASLFEIRPEAIVFPKNSHDVQCLVKTIADNKKANPHLSITPRSAGTDMSGGAINDSIIADFNKYFRTVHEVTK